MQKSKEKIRDKEHLRTNYPERFQDTVGMLPGKSKLALKERAESKVAPLKMKTELNRMESIGVITRIIEPTDWVSNIAYSRKDNGKLRICLCPTQLNRDLKRTYHKVPTVEEITHKLSGAQVLSKVDARHGYLSIVLDDESSMLTTFNTPFGRYWYLRLPFGLSVSGNIFQEKMDQILEQCPGTMSIADDIVVFGKDESEHDNNLHNLMEVASKYGLVFNYDKCEVKVPEIKFFGCIYDPNGVRPDPEKVKDIQSLPAPSNVNELQHFLGMVQHLSSFVPGLSDHTDTLRGLLRKDNDWQWTASHQKSFEDLEKEVARKCTLTYFDTKKTTTIQVDASQKELGAALLQDGKPVAFASKALTETEQQYANIERELLAVVFGCERFHTYIFGSHFRVESDHKPLVNIQHKSMSRVPPRLQRMRLALQKYDLEITYKPGREMIFADMLSRFSPQPGAEIKLDQTIHLVEFSMEKLREVQECTAKDEILRQLREVVMTGWPDQASDLPKHLRQFWSCWDMLAVEDGLLMKGDQIIIPEALRAEALERLHAGHQGVTKCQLRAKSMIFWPGINKDIEDLVGRCHKCQSRQASLPHEPLMQHEVPTRPWHTIGGDLFDFDEAKYLLLVDYYSKFPFIRKLDKSCTSRKVITMCRQIFSEHGIPSRMVSNNGAQFASEDSKGSWKNMELTTSLPAQGIREAMASPNVETVKETLYKCKESKSHPYMALLCLRTTPVDSIIPSPMEMLCGRKGRGNLPVKLRNTQTDQETIMDRLLQRQQNRRKLTIPTPESYQNW